MLPTTKLATSPLLSQECPTGQLASRAKKRVYIRAIKKKLLAAGGLLRLYQLA
jgi:hypothetical protein